ncbi:MAG: DUF861 domain-containing protein [Desulfobacter sp.]|nr:MAG: DUF861 domain-containing protein [Desulfobacter sp.]
MKKVICAKDIDELVKEGGKTLYVDPKAILTPSAKDAIKKAEIEVVEGPAPAAPAACEAAAPAAAPAAACAEGDISSDMIYKALKAMLEKGMLEGMFNDNPAAQPAAPYVSETHGSGLKLVRGNNVTMEPLDVGVPGAKVSYQEFVGKGEATTSSGLLEIENAQFDWELEYEETDYVVEGTMTVTVDGQTFTAKAGDMFFLPKGSKVVMGSPDKCKVFYTTYPAL